MKIWIKFIFIGVFTFLISEASYAKKKKAIEGIYAKITTNKGVMNFKIEYEKLPLPSCVFIGLAEGTLENKILPIGMNYYNNQKIQTVNKDKFMVLGDPCVAKKETAGFYFNDQFDSTLLNTAAGILGFVNQGPNTNSSQLYITKKPMLNLNYKYSVFGTMLSGFDVLYLITEFDTVKSIEITRVGTKAKEFICNKSTFEKYQVEQFARAEALKNQILQNFTDSVLKYYPSTVSLPSGLKIYTIKEGEGAYPLEKSKVELHYTARFEDGQIFDQTDSSKAVSTQLGSGILKRGLEEGIRNMKQGSKVILFIPYTLGYGEIGYKDKIMPRANLIYEIELRKIINQ